MPRRLLFTDKALGDLDLIGRWQTQPGFGAAAIRRLKAVRAAIRRLKQHPCLYSFGEYTSVRELPCDGGYRAVYRVDPDTGRNETAGDVMVLRVSGPGQSREHP